MGKGDHLEPRKLVNQSKLVILLPRGGWWDLAGSYDLCLEPPVPLHTLQPPQPVRLDRSHRLQQVRLSPVQPTSLPSTHSGG